MEKGLKGEEEETKLSKSVVLIQREQTEIGEQNIDDWLLDITIMYL